MRGALRPLVVVAMLLASHQAAIAQPALLHSAIRVDKTRALDGGVVEMFGDQRELVLEFSLVNHRGPSVFGIESFPDGISVSVEREHQRIDVVPELLLVKTIVEPFEEGHSLSVRLAVKTVTGWPFETGRYVVTIDDAQLVRRFRVADRTPWVGEVQTSTSREINIHDIVTLDDQMAFNEIEGQYHLKEGRPSEAIPYLTELVRLRPGAWYPHVPLGSAYFRTGRYADAAAQLEQAFPSWLRFEEHSRGDVVTNLLAASYLAMGRDPDARAIMRTAGYRDEDIVAKLRQLKAIRR